MSNDIAEVLAKQSEIIALQNQIIDRLAIVVLQYDQIEKEILIDIERVAKEVIE